MPIRRRKLALGTLPGGDRSEASAISRTGLVVGSSATGPFTHAVAWRPDRQPG